LNQIFSSTKNDEYSYLNYIMQELNTNYNKNKALLLLTLFGILCILTHCGQKDKIPKSPRIRNISKVTSPKYDAVFSITDSIKFNLKSNQDTISIDSFVVYKNRKVVFSSSKPDKKVIADQTGVKSLRIKAFLSNGKKEYHNQKITVFSNLKPESFNYQVKNTFVHDPDAYTQGLIFEDGFLYESTGQKGTSSLRKVGVSTGKVLKQIDLDDQYFGEGIAILGNEIFMLTYTSLKGFVYDKTTFEQLRTFEFNSFQSEGWGLTAIGDSLVMSDGSENLYFLDPTTMVETSRIQVYDEFKPIKQLNELEYINGKIYANIYHSDEIVIIDPRTGQVTGKLDLTGIFNTNNYSRRLDVLNGIAFNPTNGRLYVTGKWWPKLFEIEINNSTLNQ
jgi:glutamine cyclotransferase